MTITATMGLSMMSFVQRHHPNVVMSCHVMSCHVMSCAQRHHPGLGDQLTLEVLSPKLLPGQAFTPHHALDDAR